MIFYEFLDLNSFRSLCPYKNACVELAGKLYQNEDWGRVLTKKHVLIHFTYIYMPGPMPGTGFTMMSKMDFFPTLKKLAMWHKAVRQQWVWKHLRLISKLREVLWHYPT